MYQSLRSKYIKHSILSNNNYLKPHLPKTYIYSKKRLSDMLEQFGTVFLKPDSGSRGRGILRVRKKDNGIEVTNSKGELKRTTIDKLADWTNKVYLVQQGITTAKHNNANFDIRVHMLKMDGEWKIMGSYAKVGKKDTDNFVLTLASGGSVESVKDVLSKDYSSLNTQIEETSHRVAKVLNNQLVGIKELGIDFLIDKSFDLWIAEVNTMPLARGFKELDIDTFNNIIRVRKELRKEKTQHLRFKEL